MSCREKLFKTEKIQTKNNELKVKLSNDTILDLTKNNSTNQTKDNKDMSYFFEIKNNGTTKEKYEIVYEDFVSDDGKEHLDRTYLKYQLKSGDNVIKEGNLIDIKDNIIAIDEILAKTNKKYKLYIWVDSKIPSSEWVDKSYSFNAFVRQISK